MVESTILVHGDSRAIVTEEPPSLECPPDGLHRLGEHERRSLAGLHRDDAVRLAVDHRRAAGALGLADRLLPADFLIRRQPRGRHPRPRVRRLAAVMHRPAPGQRPDHPGPVGGGQLGDDHDVGHVLGALLRAVEREVRAGPGVDPPAHPDRHPELLPTYFENYRRVVYLAQSDDPDLTARAKAAADRLGLAFERRETGFGDLETSIRTTAGAA